MLVQIFIGLVVSAVGGIFFVAYKHPKTFAKYFNSLYFVNFLALIFFQIHFQTKLSSFETFLSGNLHKSGYKSVVKDLEEYSAYSLIIFLIVAIALIFLSYLPKIIHSDTKDSIE